MFKRKTFLLAMSLMLLIPLMVGAAAYTQAANGEEAPVVEETTQPQERVQLLWYEGTDVRHNCPEIRREIDGIKEREARRQQGFPFPFPFPTIEPTHRGTAILVEGLDPEMPVGPVGQAKRLESDKTPGNLCHLDQPLKESLTVPKQLDILPITEAEKEKAINIAKADSRVQQLLDKGAQIETVIGRWHFQIVESEDGKTIAFTAATREALMVVLELPGVELRTIVEVDHAEGKVVSITPEP